MWISSWVAIISIVLALAFLFLAVKNKENYSSNLSFVSAIVAILFGIVTFFSVLNVVVFSSFNISTGNIGLEKNFSGSYTGKVFTQTGTHWFEVAPSHDVEKVDIRNNKLPVEVNVMKDKTYNVNANVEVVYDLNPNKLVDLKSNYSDYKNTVIGATVKQVLTSNNTLANSQSLSETDQKQITEKLRKFGIEVTNIYMNSYKLTNSSNYGFNGTVNNK